MRTKMVYPGMFINKNDNIGWTSTSGCKGRILVDGSCGHRVPCDGANSRNGAIKWRMTCLNVGAI